MTFKPPGGGGGASSTSAEKRARISSSSGESSSSKQQSSIPAQFSLGNVTRIELKDFMCHASLDFPLDPSKPINIITGRNGAGKSSIFQALVIGLGGSAKEADRGFARSGHSHSIPFCWLLAQSRIGAKTSAFSTNQGFAAIVF